MTPLSILFGGELAPVRLIDGTRGRVWVRALPECFLHLVLQTAEHKHQLVELTSYFKAAPKKAAKDDPLDAAVRCAGAPAFPEVGGPAGWPVGYQPVPLGWTQNVSDESLDLLYDTAKKLNFGRAAAWARDQIAAKKLVAPLHKAAMEQTVPLVMQVLEPLVAKLSRLSASTPSSPSSAATPAPSSSPSL
jgi:hypothetical protein